MRWLVGRGLLVVNHEYTNPELMFPGILRSRRRPGPRSRSRPPTRASTSDGRARWHHRRDREGRGGWIVVRDGRTTAASPPRPRWRSPARRPATPACRPRPTPVAPGSSAPSTTAPAASRPGAPTSWARRTSTATSSASCRKAMPGGELRPARGAGSGLRWGAFYDRFDVSKEPNEPYRFGWIVEVDSRTRRRRRRSAPRSAASSTRARSIVIGDGRVVFYLGDDERFDYVYKFVTAGTFDPERPRRQSEPARRGHPLRCPLRR